MLERSRDRLSRHSNENKETKKSLNSRDILAVLHKYTTLPQIIISSSKVKVHRANKHCNVIERILRVADTYSDVVRGVIHKINTEGNNISIVEIYVDNQGSYTLELYSNIIKESKHRTTVSLNEFENRFFIEVKFKC